MEVRTPIILADIFNFLLPEKDLRFPYADKNDAEKIVSERVKKVIARGEKYKEEEYSGQKCSDLFGSLSLEKLYDIQGVMEHIVTDVFPKKDNITWCKIFFFVIFCADYIKYMEANTRVEFPAQRIFQSCVEFIEARVEDWIRTTGKNWDVFRTQTPFM